MRCFETAAFAAALAWAAPAAALDFINDDLSVGGQLCVGAECTSGEAFASGEVISLEADLIRLRFSDTSSGSFPLADWAIDINDQFNGGDNYYAIRDVNLGTQPFKIRNNAPSHALTVDTSGYVGMGTVMPLSELHVVGSYPEMTFEDTTNSRRWLIHAANNFYVRDITNGSIPFHIGGSAPAFSLRIQGGTGNVGLGTFAPEGKLHTVGTGVQLAYFESSDGGPVQVRFRTDSENRRFLAVDNANNVKTQMLFKDDAIVLLGETVAQEWLRVDATGITTAGPTCGSPCDAVFDPEAFEVPDIKERAARMWAQKHLPAVGPTVPGEPFNLTEKTAGMLHELEIAHIYIGQLHEEIERQKAVIKAQEDRFSALEDRLRALETH